MTITLDQTTAMLLRMLDDKIANRPRYPDPEQQYGHHLSVVAREYDQWEQGMTGLRALIGVRLINEALGQLP